ncbi:glycoside hydrolase family 76 protein [Caldivirga maquilingensis]|uniref:Glycoside hydrolase family 76 n=1 Tax=Caldivirga maquilingensis (strain ATCC 700844 / DSM 13496 / JCM 10307 / IC-167) TaxID=397948 RepID=A8MDH7_CALMQ|nr:glycoside hydrolase family 76 protein [Caldivirga maquilingensis]ABW01833.1 glycoside hydrolase family 76 [Caldivirga maquilingensis IC-167]
MVGKLTLLTLLALALIVLSLLNLYNASSISLIELYSKRAVATFNALQDHYYVNSLNLYKGSTCGDYSCLWTYSQILSALVYLSLTPGLGNFTNLFNQYYLGLSHYSNPLNPSSGYESAVTPPIGPGGDTYYDDNEWVTLALIKMYLATNNTRYLRRAEELFNFIISGWSTNESLRCPGGIYWRVGDLSRNTVSNSPAAEAAAELYLITGNPSYLKWAIRILNWVNQCLRSPSGLYYDHINPDGTIDETIWSYNQGTTAAAAALIYEATHNESYLVLAEDSAYASLSYFSQGAIYSQPPEFNAIYFRSLEKVIEISRNNTLSKMYWNLLLTYVNDTWITYRDPETGLITMGQPLNSVNPDDAEIWTAAMVQLYAIIAGSRQPIAFKAPSIKPGTGLVQVQWPIIIIIVIVLIIVITYIALRIREKS